MFEKKKDGINFTFQIALYLIWVSYLTYSLTAKIRQNSLDKHASCKLAKAIPKIIIGRN